MSCPSLDLQKSETPQYLYLYIFTFSLGPNELSFMDYVREGWRREQVEDSMDSVPKDWLKTGDSGSNFVF